MSQPRQASHKAKTRMAAGLIICFFIMGLGVVSQNVAVVIAGLVAAMVTTIVSVTYTKQQRVAARLQ